jgi:hypothetical protein
MNGFYHVSKFDITSKPILDLYKCNGSVETETLHSADEFKEYKASLFPDGLSKHGETYLHNLYKSTGPDMKYLPNEYFIETVFDLIRRLKYPERKSRFLSIFGCLSLEDAQEIRTNIFNGNGSIYKVTCEKYFKADMSLLRQCSSIIGIQIIAEKYWAGLSSTTPFWEILMEPPVAIIEKIT